MATTEESAERAGQVEGEGGPVHGGRLVARTLKDRGVSHLFSLSGGHLFSIYDGCKEERVEVVDVRHEQSAAWAAEGFAKATRAPGVCALTAGPGVTNGMSAIAGAQQNRSPLVALGGRAPEMRWGSGSLQEIDHVPFVSPLTKSAVTVKDTARIPELTAAALDEALAQPSGPTFVDYPLDFVSYAGRYIETYEPGCWMDPGPYGCLGAGPGQAIGAAKARPDRQICVLLGDGAFGFSGLEFDTMARHGLPVVGIVGNNGIWALEHHPMKFLYGYSMAAELRQGTRYDRIAEALGCHAELVERPDELRPPLERAFSAGRPALVNVLTDPEVVYPRKAV